MPATLDVVPDSDASVPLVVVGYGTEEMLHLTGEAISTRLLAAYRTLSEEKKNPSLVVQIRAETAGSPLIRALYNVYLAVSSRKGELVCVGYPDAYLQSLQSLGLPNLQGFTLMGDRDEAIRRITPRR